ncbi:MAG: hypothetical protein R2939_21660 [Kofleriaceae bacterium]
MRANQQADEALATGELLRLIHRLGRAGATGVLSVAPPGQAADVLVLRRGQLVLGEADAGGRHAMVRLARLAAALTVTARFDGGTVVIAGRRCHPPARSGGVGAPPPRGPGRRPRRAGAGDRARRRAPGAAAPSSRRRRRRATTPTAASSTR